MVYKIAAVIFSIIIQTTIIDDASAQNMVLNSDFNKFCCCQKDFSQRFSLIDVRDSNFPIDFYANNWFYSIPSSPDYYNIECSDSFITEAYIKFYKHFFDSTLLIKESSYIGINFGPDGNFETITGQLCSTLVAGENYRINLKIAFTNNVSSFSSNIIELKFSKKPLPFPEFISMNETNYIYLYEREKVYADISFDISDVKEKKWHTVQTEYTARGDEDYVTIGMFYQNNYDLTQFCNEFASIHSNFNLWWWLYFLGNKKTPVLNLNKPWTEFKKLNEHDKRGAYYLIGEIKIVPVD